MADPKVDTLAAAMNSGEVQRGEISGFWRFLERVGDVLYFDVHAWDGDRYVLALTCDGFGEEPIRGLFVDPDTRQCVTEAWPKGNEKFAGWFKWEPANFFICWPGDRGGIEHHQEWRAQRHWKRTVNPLYQYLEFIRQCLNLRGNGYQPRKQS